MDGRPFEVWEIPGAHSGLPQFLIHDGVEVRDVLSIFPEDWTVVSMSNMADPYREKFVQEILNAFGRYGYDEAGIPDSDDPELGTGDPTIGEDDTDG